jgi:hypothetical protein
MVQSCGVTRRTERPKPPINSIELAARPIHLVHQTRRRAMPNYETYYDVLSENAEPRNVFGSSLTVVLILAAALLAVSIL